MLAKDIAELMKLIQKEEAAVSQKAKEEGPSVKGITSSRCFYRNVINLIFPNRIPEVKVA